MDKREKIYQWLKCQSWGELFFNELQCHNKSFVDITVDLYLLFWYGYSYHIYSEEWREYTKEYMRWYMQQGFEN